MSFHVCGTATAASGGLSASEMRLMQEGRMGRDVEYQSTYQIHRYDTHGTKVV